MWLRAAALVLFAVATARAEPAPHVVMWRALSPAVLDRIAAFDEARSERMIRAQPLALDRGLDGRDLRPAVSAAEGPRGPIDGRDLRPAVSAAEGPRGSIDGRDLRPAVSAAEGPRGSIDADLAAIVTRACGATGRLVERAHGMSAFAIVDNIGSSPRVAPRTIILGLRFAR